MSDISRVAYPDTRSLIDLLATAFSFVWQCYNGDMEIVNFPPSHTQVGARGVCPHCSHLSYFQPVTSPYIDPADHGLRICNAAQCQSCKGYILAVGKRGAAGQNPYNLEACYPLGKPNDRVDQAVSPGIAGDFREALRCQWIKAYKATVAMCRRAIQASALEKGASTRKKLIEQIDELADKGIITTFVKEMAHEIRLIGNVGAHPDEDGLADVTEADAGDIVEFTREYFHHVYVMPAKLKARRKKEEPTAEAKGGSEGAD